MGAAGLVVALALSTAAGVALLLPLATAGRGLNWQAVLGYGLAGGLTLTTLLMRGASALGLGLGFGVTAASLGAITAAGLGVAWWLPRHPVNRLDVTARPVVAEAGLARTPWRTVLWILFVGLATVRVAGIALETWWRPLFPWDAWDIWAPKTKIWFFSRDLGNFYGHFDNGYPPAINLIQLWSSLGLGTWDDARMNMAWPLMLGALGLAAYGQARAVGATPLVASITAWAMTSLPILNVHAVLAGYADLPLAVVYGMAAMALIVWSITGSWQQLVLAVAFAAMPPLYKIPGVIWSLTLVPAALVALLVRAPRRTALRWAVGLVALTIVAGAYLYARHRNFALTLYQAQVRPHDSTGFITDNYLILGNYHLLWYALLVAVLLCARQAVSAALRPATVLLATGLGFLAASFFFTNSAQWWGDYGTINRATLHFAPLVVFYLCVLSRASLPTAPPSRSTTTLEAGSGTVTPLA